MTTNHVLLYIRIPKIYGDALSRLAEERKRRCPQLHISAGQQLKKAAERNLQKAKQCDCHLHHSERASGRFPLRIRKSGGTPKMMPEAERCQVIDIQKQVEEKVRQEQERYEAVEPQVPSLSSQDILKGLKNNEDGDAWLFRAGG